MNTLSIKTEFPIDSPEAIQQSIRTFTAKQAELNSRDAEEVEQRLRKAADVHGLAYSLYVTKPSVKSADEHKNVKYAMELMDGDQLICRKYPLIDVAQAAADFTAEAHSYPLYARKSAAAAILNAGYYSETLAKMAGIGLTSDGVANLLFTRQGDYNWTENKNRVKKLAELVKSGSVKNLDDALTIVDGLDRSEGLHKLYGDRIQTPESIACSGVPGRKFAEEEKIELQGGHSVSLAKLEKLDRAALSVLGDDIADSICDDDVVNLGKAAEVLPTLPADDVALLMGIL